MNEIGKLLILIPHWIEHNQEHAEEYRQWATYAGQASEDILKASDALELVNSALNSALQKLKSLE